MLVSFSTGNYRSFRDRVVFSMEASSIKGLEETNTIDGKLLISSAIYGANASGKSNLIKALGFVKRFVRSSSKESQSNEQIPVEPFRLNTTTESKPSFFEIIFVANGTQYRYGFEADRQQVHAEWLFYTAAKTTREYRLFTRSGDNYTIAPKFKEGKGLEKMTRNNALFLSVIDQFNGTIAKQILAWFSEKLVIISGLDDTVLMAATFEQFRNTYYQQVSPILLKGFDLGFESIYMKEQPPHLGELPAYTWLSNGTRDTSLYTLHKQYNKKGEHIGDIEFVFETHESEGTKKIVALSGPLIDTLANGKTLIVDELDARLHPLLTKKIISLFHFPKINNGAQLVFTTHDTNLLSNKVFRRDQIWFTEKDQYGSSDLYSLVEYKVDDQKVRNDASFEKDYLLGKYGAIPFIGDIHATMSELHHEKTQ